MNKEIECFRKLKNMRVLKNDVKNMEFYEKEFLKEELKIGFEELEKYLSIYKETPSKLITKMLGGKRLVKEWNYLTWKIL